MGEIGLRANAIPFGGMSNETFDAEAFPIIKIQRRDASALQLQLLLSGTCAMRSCIRFTDR